MEQLNVGKAKLTWLKGGVSYLDGGAMFGVVPKALWAKRYPKNENDLIELRSDPILLQIDDKNFLIDAGLGNDKFTEKQRRNFVVLEESFVEDNLSQLGINVSDIDGILMTHMHYDHASGLTNKIGETYASAFPDVPIYVSKVEWDEMRHPNIRSMNTYFEHNWKPIANQVVTFSDEIEIYPNLKMYHTGGHSDGHSIIKFESDDDCFIHMADIMPTHAHQPVLWVMAYDDYPMTSIFQKEKWMAYGYEKNAWYTFYHDAYYRAIQFNNKGEKIGEVKRNRYEYENSK